MHRLYKLNRLPEGGLFFMISSAFISIREKANVTIIISSRNTGGINLFLQNNIHLSSCFRDVLSNRYLIELQYVFPKSDREC